ncbi:hypothetical protein QBC38DRAFT_475706 [Podospora fimiseda]|uniref:Heterokaryon incompatibility domain-containing protein n=1 Tax=Podospora fimiseda TaxID=252190 RepID=A0AAN7BRB3_9PEZI|nr:hypothetical protein QBC38DRAFT_475706 [Podospora fimiseda]
MDNKRYEGFQISDIPRVLQDAILLTKQLSISYIWIDASCILQDAHSDWVMESSSLVDIHASAYVTICSLTPSSDISFIEPPHRPQIQGIAPPTTNPAIPQSYSLKYMKSSISNLTIQLGWATWDEACPDNRWNSRGWTFIESFSSRRMIMINLPYVLVACPSSRQYSCKGLTKTQLLEVDEYRFIDLHNAEAFLPSPAGNQSFAQDVLPALSGAAKFFANKLGDRYLAGIWESDLHRGLAWKSLQAAEMPLNLGELLENPGGSYIAPSWSWVGKMHEAFSWTRILHASQITGYFVRVGLFMDTEPIENSDIPEPFGTGPRERVTVI